MSGLMKSPKTPTVAPVTPAPMKEDAAIQEAANAQDKLRMRKGRAATLLSGIGDGQLSGGQQPIVTRGKTLLGG